MAGGDVPAGSAADKAGGGSRPDLSGLIDVSVTRCGAAAVVAVGGEVDMLTAPLLRAEIAGALAGDPQVLVLDLEAVTFFDSSALAALLDTARSTEQRGIALRLACDTAPVLRPLTATGLAAEFQIFPSRKEALA